MIKLVYGSLEKNNYTYTQIRLCFVVNSWNPHPVYILVGSMLFFSPLFITSYPLDVNEEWKLSPQVVSVVKIWASFKRGDTLFPLALL